MHKGGKQMRGIFRKAVVTVLTVMMLAGCMPALAYAELDGANAGAEGAAADAEDTEASPDLDAEAGAVDLRAFSSVPDILNNMTTRQKITQCLMMDFRKWNDADGNAQDMTTLDSDVADIIADYQFGSVILFANNIKKTDETVALTKDMQDAVQSRGGLPLLIATDQEGGIVYRLGSGTALPGNMALGATGDSANALAAGEIIGRELSSVGINTTLAPVMDVNSNANNTVIGLRAFSDDASVVGEFGSAYISGLNEYNIIGCAKHFPGHGDTETDSHYGLPVVDKNLNALMATELAPFQTAIDNGIDMIMTAHILYPQIDDTTIFSDKTGQEENRPATLSHKILTKLLRDDMGFTGVVVTDAMNMAGVMNTFTPEQSTLEALKAGADIICMPVTGLYNKEDAVAAIESVISYIESAVESGDLEEARLNEAAARVLSLKQSKGILDYNPGDYTTERALETVGSDENRGLEREIAAKAVTVIRNNGVLPYKADNETKVLMLCPYNNERAQMVIGLNRAKAEGIVPESAEAKVYRYTNEDIEQDVSTGIYNIKVKTESEVGNEDGENLKEMIDWADLVIINSEVTGPAGMSLTHWTSLGPDTFTRYCKEQGKTSVVMSVDKPYDVQLYPDADAVLAVYGCKGSTLDVTEALIGGAVLADENACGPNITAGVEVVFGVFGASGKLPVNIPEFDAESRTFTDTILYERGFGVTYDPAERGGSEPAETTEIAEVTLNKSSYTFTGKKITPILVVKDTHGSIISEDYYTVKFSSTVRKKVGKYTVTVTGKGSATGTAQATFRIVPKGTSLSKLKSLKKGIRVRWKKQAAKMASSRITGYQIQIATDKSFTKNKKTVTVTKYKKTVRKITKLKAKTKYFVRIRTYKTVSGTKYYSAWSKVRTVKTR